MSSAGLCAAAHNPPWGVPVSGCNKVSPAITPERSRPMMSLNIARSLMRSSNAARSTSGRIESKKLAMSASTTHFLRVLGRESL